MENRTKWHHQWWIFTRNNFQWERDLKAPITVQRVCLKDHSFGHTFFFIASLMSSILHYLVIKSSNPLRALDHYSNSCSPPHWHLNRIRGCICPFLSSSLAGPNSFAKTLRCWAPWTLNERPRLLAPRDATFFWAFILFSRLYPILSAGVNRMSVALFSE